jgi:DNA replication and repair protein RecF
MRVTDLSLVDFRSHANAVLRLGGGVSTFVGGNGQGKTNLLEAVAYLATLSSHRASTVAPLIRRGAEKAQIRAKLVRGERAVLVDVELAAGRAVRARVGKAKTKPAELFGLAKAVAFFPEDLALVKGGPDLRRRYLDDLLRQLRPALAGTMADYERVSRQRAALLKELARPGADPGPLGVWDEQAARLGGRITANRMALAADLGPLVAQAYSALAGGGEPTLRYAPSVDVGAKPSAGEVESALAEAMAANRDREIARGAGLFGPHREDLELGIWGFPARGYASHGESWSLALALKLGAFELMRRDAGDDPLLILDDVFAELDASRRAALAQLVEGAEQVLVTAAVAGDVPAGLTGRWFAVEDGRVEEREEDRRDG